MKHIGTCILIFATWAPLVLSHQLALILLSKIKPLKPHINKYERHFAKNKKLYVFGSLLFISLFFFAFEDKVLNIIKGDRDGHIIIEPDYNDPLNFPQ